jgi:hypothetical protein
MFTARKVAREVLPLIVLVWATLVILGGAYKAIEGGGVADGDTVASAGLGLCAVTVAALLRASTKGPAAPRPETRTVSGPGLFRAVRPAVYARPILTAPSLELLQILRT